MPNALPFSRENIRPGDRICVAISGGADSVALLLALQEANTAVRDSLGVGLSAAHVHHGIRDAAESDADLAFVRNLCLEHDIPLHIHHADVPARAAENRETIEEAARETRYAFFRNLIASGHVDSVLTAHTLDDQAETVLMKLLRGAWTEGLSGIHPVVPVEVSASSTQSPARTGKILRPMLSTTRAQIESFLKARNQPWQTDSTNSDTTYTRNRIRHELMPQLRTFNPSIDQSLANLAELAREEESRWQAELARILPQVLLPGKPVRGGGRSVATAPGSATISIEIDRLRSLDPALRRRILRAAARQLGFRLSFDETTRLLAMAGFATLPTVAARSGASVHLAQGLRAQRSAREIQLSRE
ncbi:tRNA lysidine(34) synthetase TilS [Edaphobacter sp. 12200R-103]|uniref:tRNA lysidine(34) synthetase TilS n=1 Tax=Edaphobacter sp. 12200R-103 TaxID=2703788 RepID=UPI00138C3EF4|nr:tRNA lysidine(34) synthetase TilS [Edaphobacter sp. 12200R-103]QHS51779.1 tRNA lysidine(34) synthetase TilS [Edaphobacter sp. 12200R-103]